MATPNQIAANRRNAAKSTGPRTSEGKFKSSLNALRTGVYSRRYIIATESEAVFRNFAKDLLDFNSPQNPNELQLVETMIQAAWRRRRLATLVQARLNAAVDHVLADHPDAASDSTRLTLLAAEHVETTGPSLLRQEAHEFRLAGIFERSLSRLQSSRRAAAEQKVRNEANFNSTLFQSKA